MHKLDDQRRWRLGTALGLAVAVAGCSTYKPLDQGSEVPWAEAVLRARPAAEVATASGPPIKLGGTGPVRIATLPGAPQTSVAPPARVSSTPVAEPPPAPPAEVHQVAAGEALGRIARKHGVRLHELAQANDLEPPYTIRVGQKLRIPGVPPQAEPGPRQARPDEDASPPRAVADGRYVVQPGDVLFQIARRHEVPMQELAAANGMEPPYPLAVGQELRIPQAGEDAPRRLLPAQAARESTPERAPAERADAGFVWPVEGKVIGRFGENADGEQRTGIVIAARKGAPVRAAADGAVVYAGDAIRGYGRMILLRHDDGYVTAYAHNAAILVNVGDAVERGQVIARVGDTGEAGQPQLHFEVRKGRTPVDPEKVLVAAPTELASTH